MNKFIVTVEYISSVQLVVEAKNWKAAQKKIETELEKKHSTGTVSVVEEI